jgi:hypothetical protein
MTREFQFERLDGTGTVDILNKATNDLVLVAGTYNQKVSNEGEWVKDKFRTIAKGSDPEAAIKALEDILQEIDDWFTQPNNNDSIWMRVKSNNGNARRTLVKSWARTDIAQEGFFDPVTSDDGKILSEWVIERHPDWEETSKSSETLLTDLNMMGGKWDVYSNDPGLHGGSELGRIVELRIDNKTGSEDPVKEMWIGFKPTGSAVSHDTIINCADGVAAYYTFNGTTRPADATSDKNIVMETDFAGAPWEARRFANTLEPSNITMFGQWVVLLRAKLTATGEAMMRLETTMGNPFFSAGSSEKQQDVYISSTDWRLYEMGTITLPPGMYRQATNDALAFEVGDQGLILTAEKLTGTTELKCDSWVLIPHEHFAHISEMDDDLTDIGSTVSFILTYEDDIIEGLSENIDPTTGRIKTCQVSVNNWGYPRMGAFLVVAGNRASTHVLTDEMRIVMDVFRRYKSYK